MKSQPGNFTPDVFTKKEIKSKAKRDSDDEKFKKWVEALLPTELLRCRSDWDNGHKMVGEEERAFIQQKISGLKVKQHTKERLVYVLNHSDGWTYVELWWMMILCNKPIPRVPYDTPKAGQGKEKDKQKDKQISQEKCETRFLLCLKFRRCKCPIKKNKVSVNFRRSTGNNPTDR